MTFPVYITGTGLLTAGGRSVGSTFDAICGGALIADHDLAPARSPWRPNIELLPAVSRVAILSFEAAKQAMAEAGWEAEHRADSGTALVVCTSKGPVLDWLSEEVAGVSGPFLGDSTATGWEPVPQKGTLFGLSTLTTDLAALTGIKAGPRLLASAACASGLHGLARAVMMLRSGQVRRALVVAAEASVHPLFLGSFQRLGVLCPAGEICRPFDERRNGFHIADAAAAVCLELARPADPGVEIDRIAIAGDATHLTGSDSDGVVLRHALRSVVGAGPVDFVHAHGTGTLLNDAIELSAIDSVLTGPTPVFSHKAALGHSLGASSLVSVVLTVESHRRRTIPPNTGTDRPIRGRFAEVGTRIRTAPVRRSLIAAAGFGGAVAAVTLKSSSRFS